MKMWIEKTDVDAAQRPKCTFVTLWCLSTQSLVDDVCILYYISLFNNVIINMATIAMYIFDVHLLHAGASSTLD